MKVLQLHRTTRSSRKRYRKLLPSERLGKLHPQWAGSMQPEMKGRRFGLAIVISSKVRRRNGYIELKVRCTKCCRIWWIVKSNLLKPDFRGCKSCSTTKSKHSWVLGARYDAIHQRCNTPHYPGYGDYGARGIKCLFKSRAEFVKWVEVNLPHKDYRGITIGRINNNGHYEPGNLRLETYREQSLNRRNTVRLKFRGEDVLAETFDSPYKHGWTLRLVHRGMTGDQIIENAIKHVTKGHRSKTWRQVTEWLKSRGYMTS